MARSSAVLPKLPRFLRILRARPRLALAALLGILVLVFLPSQWPFTGRLLVGWDVGIAAYLVAAFRHIAQGNVQRIRRQAAIEDEGQSAVLILTVIAALASIAAIVIELAGAKGNQPTPLALALAVVTIALSWAFIHTIFALHYAHEYYGEGSDKQEGGLEFPNDDAPDYWDFIYFSFVVGMTFQVSDVEVTSKIVRRLVVVHGVVSFIFNTALVALMVNIAASAI